MSEFSQLLSHYIHSKDIKTYALAQYCGLDRSNMYKIINGKRKPASEEMVDKMCKFMHLSPVDESALKEAYNITLVGSDNYYRRCQQQLLLLYSLKKHCLENLFLLLLRHLFLLNTFQRPVQYQFYL